MSARDSRPAGQCHHASIEANEGQTFDAASVALIAALVSTCKRATPLVSLREFAAARMYAAEWRDPQLFRCYRARPRQVAARATL